MSPSPISGRSSRGGSIAPLSQRPPSLSGSHGPGPIDSPDDPTHVSNVSSYTGNGGINAAAAYLNQALPAVEQSTSAANPVADIQATTTVLPIRSHGRTTPAHGLLIQTDEPAIAPSSTHHGPSEDDIASPTPTIVENSMADYLTHDDTSPTSSGPHVHGALRAAFAGTSGTASSFSPSSVASSPALAALVDLTPLPSPLIGSHGSRAPSRRASSARPDSRGSTTASSREDAIVMPPSMLGLGLELGSQNRSGTLSASSSIKRKKNAYHSLISAALDGQHTTGATTQQLQKLNEVNHGRNRSLSDYTPDPLHNERLRHVTISGAPAAYRDSVDGKSQSSLEQTPAMHREAYLAEQRGLTISRPVHAPTSSLPTPPSSNRSAAESEEEELKDDDAHVEYLMVQQSSGKRRLYRPVRQLGQGTFSKVMLGTSQKHLPSNAASANGNATSSVDESALDPKKLVAIKVVAYGPAGGADEQRVELGLKREVEMMRAISHPSLVRLREFDECREGSQRRALLVLDYCPGGDLFELASQSREELLGEPMCRRIFAELVGAVAHLHGMGIVHRDIKLENVLLTLPPSTLTTLAPAPATYPCPLTTLTDLGLSRRIPAAPASPLLTTRCGSEDYAAPELLLGQPYDGRATDAWALGVLLYALMEGRLPFDPPPNPRGRPAAGRSRTAHRVARCEWGWWRLGDEDGEWDEGKGRGWEGARRVVERLLRKVSRGRWGLAELGEDEWVRGGIEVEGGLSRREET